MSEARPRVRAGDPIGIRAQDWNDVLGLLERSPSGPAIGSPPSTPAPSSAEIVVVKNLGSSTIPRLAPFGLESSVFEAPADTLAASSRFVANVAIGGRLADPQAHGDRWGVTLSAIEPGRLGIVQHAGIVALKLENGDPLGDFANIEAGLDIPVLSSVPGKPVIWSDPDLEALTRWALVDLSLSRRQGITAKIGDAHLIAGEDARWAYEWTEVQLDGDSNSDSYRQWTPKPGGRSSAGSGGSQDPARYALNRTEGHHAQTREAGDGADFELFVGPGCDIDGVPLECPPAQTHAIRARPVPKGLIVELRAEPSSTGAAFWTFEAMTTFEIVNEQNGDRKYTLKAKGVDA
jgi:hypothetical protein